MENPDDLKPIEINPDGSLKAPLTVQSDDKMLKSIASSMPEPVEDAIAAAGAQEKTVQETDQHNANAEIWDRARRHKFDPSIHEVDSTGQPVFTATGRFKSKAGTRRINLPGGMSSQGQPVQDPLRVEAEKYADMFIVGGMGFVGEEFKPAEGEREGLVLAWHEIFRKYGIMPIHPIVGLCVAHGLYVFRRYDKPRTKSLLERVFNSVKFFVVNLWYKAQGKDFKVVPRETKKGTDNG